MQNFQDTFETCKRSIISSFSIWMTVPSTFLIRFLWIYFQVLFHTRLLTIKNLWINWKQVTGWKDQIAVLCQCSYIFVLFLFHYTGFYLLFKFFFFLFNVWWWLILRYSKPTKCQCYPHVETSQLIYTPNQLTGFCMRPTLPLIGLK